jgi:hypothetical protein
VVYRIPKPVRDGMEAKGFEIVGGKHLCGNAHLITVRRPGGRKEITIRYDYDEAETNNRN